MGEATTWHGLEDQLHLTSDSSQPSASCYTACLALPPICWACFCFRGLVISELRAGHKIRTIIISSAGKALSLDALRAYYLTPFIYLHKYYLTRDISYLKWWLSVSYPVFFHSTHYHLILIIYLLIVCLSLLNVNIMRVGTLFCLLLNLWHLEQCLLSARYSINNLLNEEGGKAM